MSEGSATPPGAGPPTPPGADPPGADRPFLIGLTGPMGCGKSTVAAMLGRLGGMVIDADVLARQATRPGTPAAAAIAARFGGGIVDAAGAVDRAALARIVFSDPVALADLEAIVHPSVRERLAELLASEAARAAPFVVLEAIKLVEGGLARTCDEVWLVTCSDATQRERLVGRGGAPDDIERRLAAQGDVAARVGPSAHRRLTTDGSIEATRVRVEEALAEALAPVMAPLPWSGATGNRQGRP